MAAVRHVCGAGRQPGPQLSVLSLQSCVQGVQNPIHVLDAAALGADVATVPFAVLDKLFDHPLTAQGVAHLRSPAGEGPRRIH